MRYIVTGGAGFIGSNIVDRLVFDGHEVIVVDNLSSGFIEYIPACKQVKFLNVNISNFNWLMDSSKEIEGVDGIFHLAAQSRIQPAVKNPDLAHDNNVTGVYNVLKFMKEKNINKIVFSSSSSIYGLKNFCPLKEDMPPDCLNPYSVSKYMGEQYIRTWCKLFGISGVSLRYFNVYGPREVIHLKDVAPIVGLFFRQVLSEKNPLTIIGDGLQRRDFTHVSDVVDANILAMNHPERFEGDVFNVGTGKNYSIVELADIVLESLGIDKNNKTFVESRPAECRETLADNSKAKNVLGWQPKIDLQKEINSHRDYYLKKWDIK